MIPCVIISLLFAGCIFCLIMAMRDKEHQDNIENNPILMAIKETNEYYANIKIKRKING